MARRRQKKRSPEAAVRAEKIERGQQFSWPLSAFLGRADFELCLLRFASPLLSQNQAGHAGKKKCDSSGLGNYRDLEIARDQHISINGVDRQPGQ